MVSKLTRMHNLALPYGRGKGFESFAWDLEHMSISDTSLQKHSSQADDQAYF